MTPSGKESVRSIISHLIFNTPLLTGIGWGRLIFEEKIARTGLCNQKNPGLITRRKKNSTQPAKIEKEKDCKSKGIRERRELEYKSSDIYL